MGQQVVVQARGGLTGGLQGVESHDDAHRHRLRVGVEEATTAQATGDVADHGVGGPLPVAQVEAFLDRRGGEPDDGLHPHREVVARFPLPQPGVAREEGVDPVGGDDDPRAQFLLSGAHADDLVALAHELVDAHARHDHHPLLLAALDQPGVEDGPAHRHGADGIGQPGVPVVDVDPRPVVAEAHDVAGDAPVDGGHPGEVGKDLVHDPAVEHPSGQVLRPGLGAALQQHDLVTLAGQLQRAHRPRDPGADDDGVKDLLLCHHRPPNSAVSAGTTS